MSATANLHDPTGVVAALRHEAWVRTLAVAEVFAGAIAIFMVHTAFATMFPDEGWVQVGVAFSLLILIIGLIVYLRKTLERKAIELEHERRKERDTGRGRRTARYSTSRYWKDDP